MDHRHRTIVAIKALHGGKPTLLGYFRARDKINKFGGRCLIDVHPDLKGPDSKWPVDLHRDRHAVESADPRHLICGHLAQSERAAREVPEWSLPLERLVYAFDQRAGCPPFLAGGGRG